jgi:phosphatidylinositol alpha-mannosyltransferase
VRVAIVSPYDLAVAGGVQVHVESLAAALEALGDDVHVVGPGTTGPGRTGLGPSVSVPANGSRAPIALDPRVAARVRSVLRLMRPEVVHVHEPLVPVVGPAAVLGADAPVVATFHASAEGGALPHLYRAVRRPARIVVSRIAELTAVSAVAAAFHARALGLDVEDFTIIPNGVDVARFATARDSIRTERAQGHGGSGARGAGEVTRLVFLGRLEHRKGADVAVRAFLRLAALRADVQLQVLGDGPQAAALRELVASAPPDVRGRIELAGRVPSDALPRLLADADIMILPSRGGESFGLVLLEAMASGAALVATDIPGYRAVARHDREALLVPPDDDQALASAVGRLLDDASLRDRLRAAGLARASTFDWSAVAAGMQQVYGRAAEGRAIG